MRSKQLGPHETLSQKGKKIKITVMAITKTGGQQLDEPLQFQTPSCKILISYQGNSVCSRDSLVSLTLRRANPSQHSCSECRTSVQSWGSIKSNGNQLISTRSVNQGHKTEGKTDCHRLEETREPRSLTGPWGTDLCSGDVMGNLVDRCGAWALLTELSCS